jgi:hypothetical protein
VSAASRIVSTLGIVNMMNTFQASVETILDAAGRCGPAPQSRQVKATIS